MNLKTSILLCFISISIFSCKTKNESYNSKNNETNIDNNQEISANPFSIDSNKIIKKLQGEWKEVNYPYRRAEFNKYTVKFTEEGTQENPRFKVFKISNECPFNVNNIKDLKPDSIILSLNEDQRCEKLAIYNDTLTLSGFSTNANDDYHIIYKKVE